MDMLVIGGTRNGTTIHINTIPLHGKIITLESRREDYTECAGFVNDEPPLYKHLECENYVIQKVAVYPDSHVWELHLETPNWEYIDRCRVDVLAAMFRLAPKYSKIYGVS